MNLKKLKINFRDPMVLLLLSLLVFLTAGNLLALGPVYKTVYRVELDAAFGGENKGYTGIIDEAGVNEKTVDALEALLVQDERFAVLRTHASGTPAAVKDSAAKIKDDNPALVLSIHGGWSPEASDTGTRIYTDLPGSEGHKESLQFAQEIKNAFAADDWQATLNYLYYHQANEKEWTVEVTSMDQESAYPDETPVTWTLFEETDVPAVIVEQFFVSNQSDIDRWNNEEGYKLAAEKYYTALCRYFGIEEMEFEEPAEEAAESPQP